MRSQLNQIRAWVREGRTDAWIAHQLEVPASELREFRRRHGLSADAEAEGGDDLRDEIEAEIEAAALTEDEEEDEEAEGAEAGEESEAEGEKQPDGKDGEGEGGKSKRRRRRRGGRGRRRGKRIEASFDHGERDGYGLWLDASVKDNPVYAEHWAGQRRVEVSIEPDQIVIRRSESND